MSDYNYNVPDFDFFGDSAEDKNIEAFLDIDHENDVFSTPQSVLNDKRDFKEHDLFFPSTLSTADSPEIPIRKSLSVGNLHDVDVLLSNGVNGLTISESYNNNKNLHHNKLQNGQAKQYIRSQNISKSEHYRQSTFASQEDLSSAKFVSMAEAIRQFHQRTPVRFHSKSKLDNQTFVAGFNPRVNLTVAQSPALQTKKRTRAVSVISREEKEMKDFEEAQKFKIKANPLNTNVLNTPPPISKSKKPATVPEPFNLTEVSKDKSRSSSSTSLSSFEFHAKPVPRCVKEPPKPIIKSMLCTNPRTPTFLKKPTAKVCTKEKEPVKAAYKVGPTKLIPFSFDEKIAEVKKKKEKMLNEVLEKEKKARKFHAQPIPKKILNYNQGSNLSLNKLQESDRTMTSQNSDLVDGVFKARPAKVLVQQPFIPRKSDKPLTEFVSYPTNSENRAAEREKFYQQLRVKEEMIQRAREEIQARELRLESEEVARIRKQAEHQAQPIRHYKKVMKITPKKITDPVSPKFGYIKNKENISK